MSNTHTNKHTTRTASEYVYFEHSADAVENYFKRVKMTIVLQTGDYAYVPPIMHIQCPW